MPQLLNTAASNANTTPSFLVTSGMLAKDPFPAMFSLAACKAGQYNLVTSLHKEFEPKGVHCALIVIAGTVSPESKVTNPRNIAENAWTMFSQPKGMGDLEIVLTDPAYAEHIKRRGR
jgi:short-subunit dehydrogenase